MSDITSGLSTVSLRAISLGAVAFGSLTIPEWQPDHDNGISLGAVAFGSLTYIGNGPNFMVKSIAESNGVKMPGFVGYVLRYSIVFFLPVYCVVYFCF